MREFKFRAWDKRSKKMISSGIQFNNTTMTLDCIEDIILMQYTGLKDVNQKEIYEGDVVGAKDDVYTDGHYTFIREVKFLNGMVCLEDKSYEEEFRALYWYDQIEIIGNIHENPERLKKG